eukprot:322428_1
MEALFVLLSLCSVTSMKNVSLTISNTIANKTGLEFLSYTVDFSQIIHSNDIDLSNSQLQYLASQLSPSWLRVGGTSADYTYYEVRDENPCHLPSSSYHCLSMKQMKEIIDFGHAAQSKLIFGLSAGYPKYPDSNSKAWNYSNTEQFLQYLHSQNYTNNDIYGFQLGNELNADVSPSWQSNAFHKLHSMLNDIFGTNHGFTLHGPDPHSDAIKKSNEFQWIIDFVQSTCDVLHGISYHCKVTENSTYQLTPNGLEEQYKESLTMTDLVAKANCSSLIHNIWPSEIAEQDGGIDGYTNAYFDGFWYLNALGSVSSLGQIVFARQTLGHMEDALLEDQTYIPYPDYYIAVLYNRLMSNVVLNTESNHDHVQVYAQCVGNKVDVNIVNNGVCLAYVNVYDNGVGTIVLNYDMNQLGKGDVYLYALQPDGNSLNSKKVKLNGNVLQLNHGKLPSMNGEKVNNNGTLSLPPYSYGFVVFTDTDVSVCA